MDLLAAIKTRSNIVDEIDERIELIKRGRSIKALCPFHDDKNPSLIVSESKQLFKCFSCGMGGDVVKFIMEYEKITFKQTIKKLALKYGIPLPTNFNIKQAIIHDAYINEKAIYEQAQKLYYEYLLKAQNAKTGRDYLIKRKVSRNLIDKFKVGFAPGRLGPKNFLYRCLIKKNSTKKVLSSGLVKKDKYNREQDFFYERVMFPIRNEKGEVLGFGGRDVEKGQRPKYINSSDAPWFKKGELLYGFYESYQLLIKKKVVYLVEGYFDVLAIFSLELPAVSPLGTSLTLEQTIKLKRYVDKIYLVMDSDEAGVKATLRAITYILKLEIDAYIIPLPNKTPASQGSPGSDPFDFVQGKERIEVINYFEANKTHVYDYLMDQFDPNKTDSDNQKKQSFLEILNFFSLVKDSYLKKNFSEKIEEKFKLSPLEYLKSTSSFKPKQIGMVNKIKSTKPTATSTWLTLKERELVVFLCQYPSYINKAKATLSKNNFVDKISRYIFEKLIENYSNEVKNLDHIFAFFSDPKEKTIIDFITRKLLENNPENLEVSPPNPEYLEQLFQNKIVVIRKNHLKLRKEKIDDLIKVSQIEQEIYQLIEEKQIIIQEEENLKKFLEEKPN